MYPFIRVVASIVVLVLPLSASADDVSFLIRPSEPPKYSCASFKEDAAIDKSAAVKKALTTIGDTLNFISDGTAFDVYKDKFKDGKNGLALTLALHRELVTDNFWIMKLIQDEMETKGPIEFILSFCDLRKDTEIREIASSFSMAVTSIKKKIK